MKIPMSVGMLAGVILSTGVLSGCVTSRARAPEFSDAQPVREVEETAGVISTVTEEGPFRHTSYCPPWHEVARPDAPSVEVGISAPVAPGPSAASTAGPTFYSRYECH